MGLGSGEYDESRFLRKCIDGGHADIGHRRRAVGIEEFPRRVNRRETGVEQEASSQKRFATKATLHFRGGGGPPVSIADEAFAALILSNACFMALREIRAGCEKLLVSSR
jgi:hypothetical protein